ncbi:MAG: hypothetical protein M0Z38_07095 [Deltaproteobacteria bacterium]|nr:hypothetical protein [Deltaproteobacteria bacterium]
MLHDLRRERLFALADGDGTGGSGGSPGGDPPAAQEWFTGLPDTLKPDAAVFEPFKDRPVTDVLGAFRDLSRKASEYAVPATPAEYGIKMPTPPAGISIEDIVDQKGLEEFVAMAHKAGTPAKVLQGIVDQQVAMGIAAHAENKKAAAEADKALRTSWGEKYDQNRALVEREIKALPKKTQDIITKSGLGEHPHLYELLFDVASARGEGRLRAGGDGGADKKSLSERLYGPTTT